MSSSERDEPSPLHAEVGEWLESADTDVAAARLCLTPAESLMGVVAYHCQQAAEKLMKAALILRITPYRRTHNLDELADAVGRVWPEAGRLADPLRPLTAWGVAYRYPMQKLDSEPPTPPDAEAALDGIGRLRDLIAAELARS